MTKSKASSSKRLKLVPAKLAHPKVMYLVSEGWVARLQPDGLYRVKTGRPSWHYHLYLYQDLIRKGFRRKKPPSKKRVMEMCNDAAIAESGVHWVTVPD